MAERTEPWLFYLTVATAVSLFIGIAVAQTLMAVTCLVWLVSRARPIRVPPFWKPLAALMLLTVVSLVMSPDPSVGFPPFRKMVLIAPAFMAATFVTTDHRARVALTAVSAAAALASVLGMAQFSIQYAEFLQTRELASDPTVLARITGMMGHWMTYSGQQMLVWSALLPVVILRRPRWGWMPLALVGGSIVLSFTRGVWLGSMAGTLAAGYFVPKRQLARLLVPVLLVAVAVSGLIVRRVQLSLEEGFTPDTSRLEMMAVGLSMMRDHPLVGVGPERVRVEFPGYYAGNDLENFYSGHLHNNFLQLGAERGLPAVAAFVWFLAAVAWHLLGCVRNADVAVSSAAVAGFAALAAFTVGGLFEYNFGDSEVLMLFFFIVATPHGLSRTVEGAA